MSEEEGITGQRRRQNECIFRFLTASVSVVVVIVVLVICVASNEGSFRGGRIHAAWGPRFRGLYLDKEGILGDATSIDTEGDNDHAAVAEKADKSPAKDYDEEPLLHIVEEKCQPRDLVLPGKARQFAHLHHMKTGGTSFNGVIQCALNRARSMRNEDIPYYSLSECGWGHFYKCLSGDDPSCTKQTSESIVMQYCAPLFAVNHFDWIDADLVTILRDPVDRVWSMYRFQTKSCYKCLSLKEIYEHIDNGTTSGEFFKH